MKKKLLLATCFSAVISLSGCASMDKAGVELWNWDIRGNQPVVAETGRAAPLVVPPDFALEPTQAIAARPQESGQEQVLEAMFGGSAQRSAAERAISTTSGAAEMGIRSSVGDPQTMTVNKGTITRDIIAAPEGDGQNAQAVIPR
jgi:type IV pilus biogenesis protein CpaD/CtpE